MYLYRLASSICRPRCLCLPWRSLRPMQQQQRYLRTRPTRARLPRRAIEADVAESQSPVDDLVAYDDIVFTDKSAYVPFGGRLPAPRLQPAPSPAEDPLIKDRRYAKVVEQPPAPTLRAPPPPAPASAPPPPSVDPGVLSSETLNTYTIALPPSRDQLAQANKFFARTEPTLLYTAGKFHECPASPFPEVAFLGRSNVGKSSLFNALLNRSASAPAHVSSRPGKTKTMNGFGVGGPGLVGAAPTAPRRTVEGELVPARQRDEVWKRLGTGGLVIVDMPGYGGGSREEWGKAALMFLKERKQLRRAFLLIDVEHGPKATDLELLRYLQTEGISWQVVLSKVDKALMKHGKAPKSPEGMGRRLAELRQAKEKYTAMIQEVLAGGGRRQEPSPAATPKPLDDLSVLEAPKKRKKGPRMVGMDVLCCSSEKSIEGAHRKIGIDELRWAIMTACGIEAVD